VLSNNSVKISQISLSVIALFAIILISGVTVTALNPIVEDSKTNINSGKVAGVSTTNLQNFSLNLELNNQKNSNFNVHLINSHSEDSRAFGTIIVDSSNLAKGIYVEDLLTIYNPNNVSAKAKVKFFLPQELKGKIKIYLEDAKDSLVMYTIEESYGPKTITLPELSERKFKLKIEAIEDVLVPVELVFVFTVGE